MKKRGFTLAEVLITLGIIGVVSALVIPQFVNNAYDQANASKLSSVVSDYENIFAHMLLREDRENFLETDFGNIVQMLTISPSNKVNADNALNNYTRVANTGRALTEIGYPANTKFKYINGGANTSIPTKYGILTNGGAAIIYERSDDGSGRNVYIDVNGSNKPNTFGRDVFAFIYGEDGHLYPFGSKEASQLQAHNDSLYWRTTSNADYSCNNGSYHGQGCTARLIENNYKMDY